MYKRQEYDRYLCVLRDFNRRLDHLAYVIGIKCKLSSYTPRHTWATLAYRKKCPIGIISNALGHSSIKVTETYLKPFETEELDKANRMVIACVKDGLCLLYTSFSSVGIHVCHVRHTFPVFNIIKIS